MRPTRLFAALLATTAPLIAAPAAAQNAAPSASTDVAALRAEVDALTAELAAMRARLDALQTPPPAPPVIAASTAPAAPAPQTTTEWKGAPEVRLAGGWSFKPRGRVQIDAGGVDAPAAINDRGLGFGSELRRVYLGFDGTIPGGFGYRVEADLADNAVALTDVYLTYGKGPLTVTLGQHKSFSSLEDQTSDLYTTFTERAAFNSAFNFRRRVGLSGTYVRGAVIAQAGLFTDDVSALGNAANNSWSADGRLVFGPKAGETQLHFGGSLHRRDFNDAATGSRYRARPFIHTTDTRLVDTGTITAVGEASAGLEFAAIRGRLHVASEAQWLRVRRPGLADPTFTGGYVEGGLLLTDDSRVWRNGTFDRIVPKTALGSGGSGAVELNLRYDWLDLSDAGIVGGRQGSYGVGLTWIPVRYVRFIVNYGRVEVRDARVAAGADRNYGANVVGMRGQIDF